MQERGSKMVSNTTYLETPVKIEFNIAKEVMEYNAHEHLSELLHKMKDFDNSLRVQSSSDTKIEWVDIDMLPEGTEFIEHFQLKDLSFRTHKKVIMHMTLVTIVPVNKIKYSQEVKEHIFQQNIWLKNDRYNAKIESSPGFFIRVHPKLLHREDFGKKLNAILLSLTPDVEEQIVIDWYNLHDIPLPRNGDPPTIPIFHLETSIRKWGGFKSEVLRITSSQDDSEFLKYLLSLAGEKQLFPKGKFIPEGLQLMQGKKLVTSILSEQQEYLDSTVGIPITGVSVETMNQHPARTEQSIRELIEANKGFAPGNCGEMDTLRAAISALIHALLWIKNEISLSQLSTKTTIQIGSTNRKLVTTIQTYSAYDTWYPNEMLKPHTDAILELFNILDHFPQPPTVFYQKAPKYKELHLLKNPTWNTYLFSYLVIMATKAYDTIT